MFLPPLVCVAARGQRAGDFGGRGWGGVDTFGCMLVFSLQPSVWEGAGGRGAVPAGGLEGTRCGGGLWGGLEPSPGRPNEEAPQNHPLGLPRRRSWEVTGLVLPAPPT